MRKLYTIKLEYTYQFTVGVVTNYNECNDLKQHLFIVSHFFDLTSPKSVSLSQNLDARKTTFKSTLLFHSAFKGYLNSQAHSQALPPKLLASYMQYTLIFIMEKIQRRYYVQFFKELHFLIKKQNKLCTLVLEQRKLIRINLSFLKKGRPAHNWLLGGGWIKFWLLRTTGTSMKDSVIPEVCMETYGTSTANILQLAFSSAQSTFHNSSWMFPDYFLIKVMHVLLRKSEILQKYSRKK